MPSARGIVCRVVDGLSHHLSQLVFCPGGVEIGAIADAVRGELFRRDFSIAAVFLPTMEGRISAEVALAEEVGVSLPTHSRACFIEEVIARPGWPDVVMLEGFEALNETSQERWLLVLNRWAQASQRVLGEGRCPPSLFCVARPAAGIRWLACNDLCLKIEWWWNVPSALELQLLCRMRDEWHRDAASAWREHLLPSLCGGDVGLFAKLWPTMTATRKELCDALRCYASERGWEPDELAKAVDGCYGESFLPSDSANRRSNGTVSGPPESLRVFWLRGLVQSTAEYGCEFHTGALAVLEHCAGIEHRLWRAQAALLLPLLDAHRHRICRDLTDRYGADWPVRWQQPLSPEESLAVKDDPLACQWGYLENLLRTCPALRRERSRLVFVAHCRFVRNKLAHYRPVEFSDFQRVWNG